MTLDELLEKARKNYPSLEKFLDVDLDYSVESLRRIDTSILIKFQPNHIPHLEVIAAMGLYYGEVIVKHYKNAQWRKFEGKDLSNVSISITNGKQASLIFPLVTMNKLWHSKKDLLTDAFKQIEDVYGGELVTIQ